MSAALDARGRAVAGIDLSLIHIFSFCPQIPAGALSFLSTRGDKDAATDAMVLAAGQWYMVLLGHAEEVSMLMPEPLTPN